MEVKIQYVVDLEDVVTEVAKLLPSQSDLATPEEVQDIREYLSKGKVEVALSLIQSLRKEMYHKDQRLSDCQAILTGYLGVINKEHSPPVDPTDPATDPADDLEASLKYLRDSMAGMDRPEIIENGEEDDSPS